MVVGFYSQKFFSLPIMVVQQSQMPNQNRQEVEQNSLDFSDWESSEGRVTTLRADRKEFHINKIITESQV